MAHTDEHRRRIAEGVRRNAAGWTDEQRRLHSERCREGQLRSAPTRRRAKEELREMLAPLLQLSGDQVAALYRAADRMPDIGMTRAVYGLADWLTRKMEERR